MATMALGNMQLFMNIGSIQQILNYKFKRPYYIFTFLEFERKQSIHTKERPILIYHIY